MLERLSQYITMLSTAESMKDLEVGLELATRGLGFATFNISLNKTYPVEFMEDPMITTWSNSDLAQYVRDGWADRDPLLRRTAEATKPFIWRANDWHGLGRLEQEYVEYLDISGVAGGVTIPLHRPTGGLGALTLLSVTEQPLTLEALHGTQILAHMAMARASALTEDIATSVENLRRMRLLSKHQVNILRWVALGKTNREIAVIMGSTHRTIDYHLQEILSKLGVSSRTHAVAIFASAEP